MEGRRHSEGMRERRESALDLPRDCQEVMVVCGRRWGCGGEQWNEVGKVDLKYCRHKCISMTVS
jgi:hypothetical protein